MVGSKYRTRSVDKIIEELKVLSEELPAMPDDSKKAIEKLEIAKNKFDDKLNKFRLR